MIEADFQAYYGLDLLDLLRRCQWRKIVNFIRRLPKYLSTQIAIGNDDELVFPYLDYLDERGELNKSGKVRPSLEGRTETVEKLDEVKGAVFALIALVDRALTGGKNAPPEIPLPETARERWERQRSERKRDSLLGEIKDAQQRYARKHDTNS